MKFIKRVTLYLLGLFIITIGVNLSIISELGVSPVSALTYPLSVLTNVSLGAITLTVYTILVLLQVLMLKKDFKLKDLLQIPFSICFGFFVNFSGELLSFVHVNTYYERLALLLLSILVCAIGAVIYIVMDIVPNAPEGFNLAISKRFKLPFSTSKILSDSLLVFLGVIVIFITKDGVMVIREGTMISVILTGKLIGMFKNFMEPKLKVWAFEE